MNGLLCLAALLSASTGVEIVDLRGHVLGVKLTKSWIGQEVSSVVSINDISKVLVLEAVTSAPIEVDIDNVISSLKHASVFKPLSEPIGQIIWRAVLVKTDGSYIHYISDGNMVLLIADQRAGAFRWK